MLNPLSTPWMHIYVCTMVVTFWPIRLLYRRCLNLLDTSCRCLNNLPPRLSCHVLHHSLLSFCIVWSDSAFLRRRVIVASNIQQVTGTASPHVVVSMYTRPDGWSDWMPHAYAYAWSWRNRHCFARARRQTSYRWWPKVVAKALRSLAELPVRRSPAVSWPRLFERYGEPTSVHRYCLLFEPFIDKAIVATLKMRHHGHIAMVRVGYTTVSVSTRFTHIGAFGPRCVNPVETSTSWYNLYIFRVSLKPCV